MHRPRLLLLDEATAGADVETRTQLVAQVRALAAEGSAVLYSTHYLQEVETLGASVVLIDKGSVLGARGCRRTGGPARRLRGRAALRRRGPADHPTRPGGRPERDGNLLRIPTAEPGPEIAAAMTAIGADAARLQSVEVVRANLETAYLAITGRRYEPGEEVERDVSPRACLAVFRHELRVLRRDPSTAVFVIVMPLVLAALMQRLFKGTLVAQGVTGATGAEFAVPGMAVSFAAFGIGYAGFAFFRDHGWGTWERLRASQASSLDILVGKVAPAVGLSLLQMVVLFVLAVPLFGLGVTGSWPALLAHGRRAGPVPERVRAGADRPVAHLPAADRLRQRGWAGPRDARRRVRAGRGDARLGAGRLAGAAQLGPCRGMAFRYPLAHPAARHCVGQDAYPLRPLDGVRPRPQRQRLQPA